MNRLRLFISVLTILFATSAWAFDFTRNYINYKILSEEDKTVEVCDWIGSSTTGNITIPAEVKGYTVVQIGDSALVNKKSLISVIIPESITHIGKYAFSGCSNLSSVEILNGVTKIGEHAFFNCGLKSITIPGSVLSIGEYAFGGCRNLTSIVVDSNNKVYDSRNNCNALIYTATDSLILGCNSTVIPDGIKTIGKLAFSDYKDITSIDIPSSVISIGEGAFEGCEGLTSVVIPNSVTAIGNDAFSDCKNLNSVILPNGLTAIGEYTFDSCESLTSIIIPNSVTTIGDYAFNKCNLMSLTIPGSVSSIGEGAFEGSHYLKSIVVDSSNKVYDSRNNCNALIYTATDSLILGCNTTVIPDDVKIIGQYAFYNYWALTSIIIPSSVISIGEGAFQECRVLTSIVLSNGLENIGEGAFHECTSLTSVAIPNTVTTIGRYAFYKCTDLASVVIPSSVTTLGDFAFRGCKNIASVYNYSETPQETDRYFFSTYKELHVIKGKKDAYAQAKGWSKFTIIDDLEPEVPTSVNTVYCNNENAKTYTLDGCTVNDNYLKKGIYIKNGKKFFNK